MIEIPSGWTITPLEMVGDWGSGGTPKRTNQRFYLNGTIPWLVIGDLNDGIVTDAKTYITEEGLLNSSAKLLPPKTLLIAMYGSIGKLGITAIECATNQAIAFCRPNKAIELRYLFYALKYSRDELISQGQGGAQQNISQTILKAHNIPLAPLNEQRRIEDKLDRILAKVEACRERCDRIPLLLKRFRQSVLAAATSGQLSEDWRSSRDVAQWQSVSLNDVCLSITDGDHQAPPQVEKGIPFITIAAINDGKLRIDKATRFVSNEYFEQRQPSRKPKLGDVLFSVTGSIAIPVLVDTDEPFTFQRHIAILKPDLSKISSLFLLYSLGTKKIKNQSLNVATGTAQLTIPLSGLRKLVIDLPMKDEQDEIVRRIEVLFSYADRLEAQYQRARAHIDRLTPALLDKAFRGELVPQDPKDEPASVLLERIRSEISKTQTRKIKRLIESIPSQHSVVPVAMLTRKEIQPSHLSAILKERGPLTAESLWTASQLDIDDFYDQLKDEETQGLLRETRGEDPNAARLLEVT